MPRLIAIARRDDRDDFLFRTADGRFAMVHMSYSGVPSTEWPRATVYDTFKEWFAAASK